MRDRTQKRTPGMNERCILLSHQCRRLHSTVFQPAGSTRVCQCSWNNVQAIIILKGDYFRHFFEGGH